MKELECEHTSFAHNSRANGRANLLWNIRAKISARGHSVGKRRPDITNLDERTSFGIALAKEKKVKRNGPLWQYDQVALQESRTHAVCRCRKVSRTYLLFAKLSREMMVLVQPRTSVPVQSL